MNRVPALVVMHGGLADALLRAAARVYGAIEGIEVLSNEGLSRPQLEEAIRLRLDAWPHGGLVLTDFWGGSCHVCGASALRGHGEVLLVTGLNLPMLLDFLHNRDRMAVAELGERLVRKGQESVRLQGAPPE